MKKKTKDSVIGGGIILAVGVMGFVVGALSQQRPRLNRIDVMVDTTATNCYETRIPELVVCTFRGGRTHAFKKCGDTFVMAESPCEREDGVWGMAALQ